jgi:hypothetical protein
VRRRLNRRRGSSNSRGRSSRIRLPCRDPTAGARRRAFPGLSESPSASREPRHAVMTVECQTLQAAGAHRKPCEHGRGAECCEDIGQSSQHLLGTVWIDRQARESSSGS